ncbi:porin PorA family protein [Streptomyces sp. NPDC005917]|uniref:porin PorA family protein n=1 Tax=unclassified Streptomyces TaxID=2593676 RepID=UPI00340EB1F3
MRRKASLVLLACAVFFAALSPLLRWYAFPRLAKIPANQYQDMVLVAKDATLLYYGTTKAKKAHKEKLRGGTLLGGRAKVTAFADDVKMREDYTEHTVALVKHNRTLVLMLTSCLPWGFLSLGIALLALSLCLEALSRRPADPQPAQSTPAEPVSA